MTRTVRLIPASHFQGDWRNWGPWRLDAKHRCLVHVDEGYEIDLDWCRDSAEVLDWVAQIAAKVWADNATVAGLVRALDDVLYLQANVCSWGKDHRLSLDRIAELVREVDPRRHTTCDA